MRIRELGKVIITGADGFIGSHLTEALIERGYEVTALCIYNSLGSYGWLNKYSENAPKNLRLELADIRDPENINRLVKGHKTCFHLASLIAIPYSYEAPRSYFETNLTGTLNIANACLNSNIERIVHTSTSEVYGTAKYVPIDEHHTLNAQSPYAASKIAADKVIQSYHCAFNLPAVTLRPFNTYGPRQSLRAVIPTIAFQIMQGHEKLELGNVTPTRDFNFVSDTVNAFLSLGETSNDDVLGEEYNAGSGKEISIGDLAALIGRIMNKKVAIESTAARKRSEGSEVERLLCCSKKLTSATGWKSTVELNDGLEMFIKWLQDNNIYSSAARYWK